MTFKEKFTWVILAVFVAVPSIYFTRLFSSMSGADVSTIAYQVPLIISVAVSVVFTIAGAIVMGIGTGIAITISGEGSTDDIGRDDERDSAIDKRGELAGSYAAAAGAFVALVLAMMRIDQFWIANTIYLSFVASSVTAAIVKLVIYRRGF